MQRKYIYFCQETNTASTENLIPNLFKLYQVKSPAKWDQPKILKIKSNLPELG